MKILITGINGFAGSHLCDYILSTQEPVDIYGTIRHRSNLENLEHIKNRINLIECDLRDASSVTQTIKDVRPDKIFHLAAQSFVPTSWKIPTGTFETNIIGQLNLFEAVRQLQQTKGSQDAFDGRLPFYDPIIQIACSSEEYGAVDKDNLPSIKETCPLRPLSPYAVSKVTQDMLGYQYFKSYGLKIIRTRAFNHSGPRRPSEFVDSSFARQIAEIEAGLREPVISVGNLEAIRDFTDVRDIVWGYWMATEKGEPGEVYNLCSGIGYKISTVLMHLISLSTVKSIEVKEDPARMRPSDLPVLVGNFLKFKKQTGWQPVTSYLEKTLPSILDYWRKKIPTYDK